MKTQNSLHIFKAGQQTAMSGASLNFTESDLAASAAAYDPNLHEAPIVIGHPKADAPAYGWVKKLGCDATGLHAEPTQVDAAFAELVEQGRYKKISASFYMPDSPANPVPGTYYLRHVGFLGAQPPAVKGLKAVEFNEAEAGVIEFADWDDVVNASMWRNLRDWVISKFGLEEADKAIPTWDVSTLEQAALQPEVEETDSELASDEAMNLSTSAADTTTSFNEPSLKANSTSTVESLTVTPEQAASLTAENQTLRAALAEVNRKNRTAEFSEFIAGLVQAGKVLPVEQANLINFAACLDAEQTVEFGEGDSKTTHTHLDAFKQLLAARPAVVNFGEQATGELKDAVDLNNPQAIKAAAEQLQKAAEAKGQTLSYNEAVSQVVNA